MDLNDATRALSGLSQQTRLETFRLLVRCGDDGLPAGEIGRALDVPHNTLSAHLAILSNAGLIRSRREGRSVIYSVDFTGVRNLMSFLMEDCCQGRPEICGPALDSVVAGCCGENPQGRTQ
jgi:DNA-binding transcriptional ArsR family regulator